MKFTWMLATAIVAAAPAAPFANTIDERLQAANPAAGETAFRQCRSCHTVDQGGANRVGPNLWGVVGRDVASVDGFRYSDPMVDYGGTWTPDRLDAYLEDPRGTVPGTRMSYRGIKDAADRADMIAYLNANSDQPLDFAAIEQSDTAAPQAQPEEDFGLLVNEPGVEETFYACTGCHSEMIVVQQGKTRENWDKLFAWMVEEQGMAELPEDEREVILDYLAAHYNTDRPNFPSR